MARLLLLLRALVLPALSSTTADDDFTPIVINNFNRLASLQQQLAFFDSQRLRNVHILDNNSTFPPLLAFYDALDDAAAAAAAAPPPPRQAAHAARLHRLGANFGSRALWRSRVFPPEFFDAEFVLTDADVVPNASAFAPPGGGSGGSAAFLQRFRRELRRWPLVQKVGCALALRDLPRSHAPRAQRVLAGQAANWEMLLVPDASFVDADPAYVADIDTTLALYRGGRRNAQHCYGPAVRVGGAYAARHLPWYESSGAPSVEERFYERAAACARGLLRHGVEAGPLGRPEERGRRPGQDGLGVPLRTPASLAYCTRGLEQGTAAGGGGLQAIRLSDGLTFNFTVDHTWL